MIYNGSTTPVNFMATLTGVGAVASSGAVLAPNPLDLGSIPIGSTIPTGFSGCGSGCITLTNASSLPLAIGTVTGTNFGINSVFWLLENETNFDQCSNQTIAPQGSCSVYTRFTPSATGTRTGTLVFPVTYGGATSPVNVTAGLSGFGLAANTTVAFTQNTVAFGNQAVGASGTQVQVLLTNYSSTATVSITSVVLGGANASDFTESDSCEGANGTTLGPNSSCSVYVSFTPSATSLGARTATVTETDPATGSPRVLTLTGTGVADSSAITFYPSSLSFATNETVNEGTVGKVVGLNYTGTLPLTVTSVTSSDPADFPVVGDGCSGGTVANGAACQITVAFTPTRTGTISATISVVDSGNGSPQRFTVTGGGAAVVATTTTLTATPATGATGTFFTLTATVEDASGDPVQNGSVTFVNGSGATAKQLETVQVVRTASGGGTIGTATYKTSSLPLGVNSIKAHYMGADAASASAATTVTVTGKYPSSVALSSSGVQGDYTLVGTVSGGGPVNPSGSVVFDDAQATSALGTATLDPTTVKETALNVSTPSIGPGSGPTAVVVADVNGDGIPDILASYNNNSFAFSVLLGDGDGTYKTAQPVPGVLGGQVSNMVVGDFNGDGKLDVALSGVLVEVFLGNGDGTFQGEVDYGTSGVEKIALGDFNGDGILDIVAGNSSNGTVDLLIGNGDGTFQYPVSTVEGDGFALIAADVNGDGKLDVVVQDAGRSGIDVLLGNGNGTFQAAKFSPTNYFPYKLAGGDINDDGKFDLVTNDNDTSIGILIGNGDGTFQAEQTLISGAGIGQQVVADVNGDGNPDLILPDYSANTLDIYSGNGDGTFQPVLSYATGSYPIAAKAADLNGDGKVDIVVVNQTDGTASVFLNQVTETATLTGVTLPGVTADAVTGVYSGDTNYLGATSNTLTLASNASAGSTTLAVTPTRGAQGTVFTLTATVVDGSGNPVTEGAVNFYDGTTLLASVQLVSGTSTLTGTAKYETRSFAIGSHSLTAKFAGTGTNRPTTSMPVTINVTGKYASTTALAASGVQGSYALTATVDGFGLGSPSGNVVFTDTSTSTTLGTVPLTAASVVSGFIPGAMPEVGDGPSGSIAGDFNGDGIQDIAVCNASADTIGILLGTGAGNFKPQVVYALGGSCNYLLAADLNGDGNLDLVTSIGYYSDIFNVLLGNGDGTFQAAVSYPSGGSGASGVALGDFNGDGKLDVVITNRFSGTVGVLLGNGNGSFQSPTAVAIGRNPTTSAVVGDFNSDGKLDFAVSNANDNSVSILLGKGDGTFQAQETFRTGDKPEGVATGDFNGDGKLDLAVADYGLNSVSVLLGNGDGTFTAHQEFGVGSGPFWLVAADLDGDGKLDLAVTNYSDGTIGVLRGDGGGTFGTQQVYPGPSGSYVLTVADLNGDGRPDIFTAGNSHSTSLVLLGTVTEAVSLTGVTLPGSGADKVVAIYSGDTSFAGSTSNTLTLPSHPTATTTTLSVTPASGALGSTFTLSATVTDAKSNPVDTGTVTLYSGTTVLATVQLTEATGTATLKALDLPKGSDVLKAVFNGTDTEAPSTSATKTVTVTGKYATTTTLASTGSVGDYTLTATVGGYGPGSPSGNVVFTDTTSGTTLGTMPLSAVAGSYGLMQTGSAATPNVAYYVTLADLNGDGRPDMVVSNYSGPTFTVFLGNGDGTFQAAKNYGTIFSGSYALAIGDLNGDGKLDVITANGPSVGVFLGNGDGTFAAEADFVTGSITKSVTVGDFNHDGKLDLVTANANAGMSSISVLLGNGDGTFQPQQSYAAGLPQSVGLTSWYQRTTRTRWASISVTATGHSRQNSYSPPGSLRTR